MADHFWEVFTNGPHSNANNNNFENNFKDYLTKKELQAIIRNYKNHKAPGNDLIAAKVLKELSAKGLRYITILINAILRVGHFP